MLNRRDFLRAAGGGGLAGIGIRGLADEAKPAKVMTVTGAVPGRDLGLTLPHEHVLVDFIGAEQVSRDRYKRDEVVEIVLPYLKKARQAGCRTLVECTPAYLGRDPVLLRRLEQASELRLVTNTGYYGARGGQFLPQHAFQKTADKIADRWLAEWEKGIEGTDIRPGFIKIGVDQGPLSEVNRKLVQAAARAHLQSGLTIACHTGDGAAAMEELNILRKEGVSPKAWIWVHAQNEQKTVLHRRAAEDGGWVEFDGIRPETIGRHVRLVKTMKKHGVLDRVLLSHDAGWYSVGQQQGGDFRGYRTLLRQFLPALKKAGFTEAEIEQLTVTNPARAFAVRLRADESE